MVKSIKNGENPRIKARNKEQDHLHSSKEKENRKEKIDRITQFFQKTIKILEEVGKQ